MTRTGIKANPEIVELKFECEVRLTDEDTPESPQCWQHHRGSAARAGS
jgi:hypothetical protein